jgi:hypothetical protein
MENLMENLVYRVLRPNVLSLGQRVKLATGGQLTFARS